MTKGLKNLIFLNDSPFMKACPELDEGGAGGQRDAGLYDWLKVSWFLVGNPNGVKERLDVPSPMIFPLISFLISFLILLVNRE